MQRVAWGRILVACHAKGKPSDAQSTSVSASTRSIATAESAMPEYAKPCTLDIVTRWNTAQVNHDLPALALALRRARPVLWPGAHEPPVCGDDEGGVREVA